VTHEHGLVIGGGLSPNFYWSSVRGPYASIRLPGGFRVVTALTTSRPGARAIRPACAASGLAGRLQYGLGAAAPV
jgi:hypothetical protein